VGSAAVRPEVIRAEVRVDHCPHWVTGELWMGGRGKARGYRGSPSRRPDARRIGIELKTRAPHRCRTDRHERLELSRD
jgi:hypothetical protein